MPGVGVAPGFMGLPIVLGSGMPGVGVVPFGKTFTWFAGGIPGVVLVDGGIGLVDSPGGKLLASMVTFTLVADVLTLALFTAGDEHANANAAAATQSKSL